MKTFLGVAPLAINLLGALNLKEKSLFSTSSIVYTLPG